MSDLHALLDERVTVATHKASKAAREARHNHASAAAQSAAETALSDLLHYVQVRDAVGAARGPYNPASSRSFYADAVRSVVHGDSAAQHRLALSAEERSTMANYGGLVVPQYLEDKLVDSGHSTRPLLDLLAEPLPDKGASVDIPEVTTAASAEDQDGENTQGTSDNPATTGRSFTVRTAWSESAVSHAAVARAEGTGFDTLVNREILGAVNALEEARVVNGSGSNGQPVGLLNTPGTPTVTATGTTAYDLLDNIAEAAAAVDQARSGQADLVVMHPRRWRFLLANAGDRAAAITPSTTPGPVAGKVLGIDVIASPGVPVTLGTSTNEDRIIVVRRADLYVGEAPATVQIHDDHATGSSLTSLVRVVRYYASGVVSTDGVQVIVGAGTINPYA